jgi:hypothetical protein
MPVIKLPKETNKLTKKRRVAELHKLCSWLFKNICFNRDGRHCQVKKHYPSLNITHSDTFQCDHAITRANKWEFYNPKNGTIVCSNCNLAKHNHLKSVGRAIDAIVLMRETNEVWSEMVKGDMESTPNKDFNSIPYLENQVRILELVSGKKTDYPLLKRCYEINKEEVS